MTTNMSMKSNFDNALFKGTTFNVDPVGWVVDLVQTPVIETKIRSCSGSCSSLRQTSLSLLLSPTQCCCCMAQWSTFTISAFSLSVSFREAPGREQSSELYGLHKPQYLFSSEEEGERHKHLFFVCILFQNIKLNQSFNTPDCINMGGELLE